MLALGLAAGATLAIPSASASHGAEPCDSAGATVVTPAPPEYRPGGTLPHHLLADARGVTFETTQVEGWYPVILKDATYPAGSTFCWIGGTIDGNDTSSSWDTTWHKSVSAYSDHPYTTWRGVRIDGGGDCIGIKDPGDDSLTRIQGVALTACGDDAIENDLMKNVEVVDSVVEGYVVFAGRGGSAGAEDGRNNTYRIDRVIGHLRPQVDVYKGPSPGNGPLFKRPNADGSQGYEPNYTITDSIFRVDQVPNHGDLSIPPGPHSGNVIVWTGSGAYPGPVPAGFTVTTDLSVWQNARDAWFAVPQADRSQPGVYAVGTTPPPPPPPAAACGDGVDNDGDGLVDFPADLGCTDSADGDETDPVVTPPPPAAAACEDGVDNDGDGRIDFPADPGCTDSTDTDETDPATPPPPPATAGIVDRQVDSDADDVEERRSTGKNITTGSSDLEIGYDGSYFQWVGVRYQDVVVPQGATITGAYLGFTADASNANQAQIQVYGHAYDDAPAFTTDTFALSSRPLTVGEDRWFPEPWVENQTHVTRDISEVIQAIVDRPGWASGNAMSFTLLLDGDTPEGTRRADSHDGSSSQAPTLHIEYTY